MFYIRRCIYLQWALKNMKEFILAEKLKEEMAGKKVKAAVFHTFGFTKNPNLQKSP